jgi:hypothetical protein
MFLSDDSVAKGDEIQPDVCVRDAATGVLAGQLGLKLDSDPEGGPFSNAFFRAAVAKLAAEELERLKK